jgi:peptidyl-prolyl cis-trans isomerase C
MLRLIRHFLLVGLITAGALRADEGVPQLVKTQGPKLSDLFGDEVIARGKGVEVKRSQLEDAFVAHKASLALRGQSIPEERRARLEAQLLQQLIVMQILTNRVTAADLKMANELAEKRLKEAKEQSVSEEALYRQLKAAGMSPERFHRAVMEESFAQAVIKREVTSTVTITDAQVQEFYATGTDLLVRLMQADLEKLVKDPSSSPSQVAQLKERVDEIRRANLSRLEQPEKVHVSHIFFAGRDRKTEEPLTAEQQKIKRQRLEKLRQRALEGEDFSKLILEFSEDRGVKETKGEYTFSREDRFVPEFKAAAFTLAPGKISDIVVSELGFHVIKLLEKFPAKKVEFEKVAADLKEFLVQQEVQKAMPDYFAQLSKQAGLEVLDPKYKLEMADDSEPKRLAN